MYSRPSDVSTQDTNKKNRDLLLLLASEEEEKKCEVFPMGWDNSWSEHNWGRTMFSMGGKSIGILAEWREHEEDKD